MYFVEWELVSTDFFSKLDMMDGMVWYPFSVKISDWRWVLGMEVGRVVSIQLSEKLGVAGVNLTSYIGDELDMKDGGCCWGGPPWIMALI